MHGCYQPGALEIVCSLLSLFCFLSQDMRFSINLCFVNPLSFKTFARRSLQTTRHRHQVPSPSVPDSVGLWILLRWTPVQQLTGRCRMTMDIGESRIPRGVKERLIFCDANSKKSADCFIFISLCLHWPVELVVRSVHLNNIADLHFRETNPSQKQGSRVDLGVNDDDDVWLIGQRLMNSGEIVKLLRVRFSVYSVYSIKVEFYLFQERSSI